MRLAGDGFMHTQQSPGAYPASGLRSLVGNGPCVNRTFAIKNLDDTVWVVGESPLDDMLTVGDQKPLRSIEFSVFFKLVFSAHKNFFS